MKKIEKFEGTWLGRKGTSYTYHLDSKRLGLRLVRQEWADSPMVGLQLIEGDGRNVDFKVWWSWSFDSRF